MRSCQKLVVVLGLLAGFALPSYADSCQAGALSTVMGTVCTIGNLTFDFTGTADGSSGYFAANSSYSPTGGSTSGPGMSAADVQFVPVTFGTSSGFNLVASGFGAHAVQGGFATNDFHFFYGVSTTDGSETILSVNTGGNPYVSGMGAFSYLDAYGCNNLGNCTYSETWADAWGGGQYGYPVFGSVKDLSWYGYAHFYAQSNGDVATLTSGTILYDSVPEPGTMALFGAGLLGLGFRFRKH